MATGGEGWGGPAFGALLLTILGAAWAAAKADWQQKRRLDALDDCGKDTPESGLRARMARVEGRMNEHEESCGDQGRLDSVRVDANAAMIGGLAKELQAMEGRLSAQIHASGLALGERIARVEGRLEDGRRQGAR